MDDDFEGLAELRVGEPGRCDPGHRAQAGQVEAQVGARDGEKGQVVGDGEGGGGPLRNGVLRSDIDIRFGCVVVDVKTK